MPQNIRSQSSPDKLQTRNQIKKTMRPAIPRDDLTGAHAGKENLGNKGVKSQDKSTNVKSRKTAKSKTRTPII